MEPKLEEAERRIQKARKTGETGLDLSDMGLTSLPESLVELRRLRSLYLRNNELTMLPEALVQLTKLRSLNLSDNELTTLPEALVQLTQLQELYLSNNQLTTLLATLGQLTQLEILDLSNNQLTTLPEALVQLTQLQELYLSNNQLTTLPEALVQLTQLEILDLSNNELTTLLATLGQLTQLQDLYLSNNQLKTLPEALVQLAQLQSLDLSNNQLTTLPEALVQLMQLQTLHLDGNGLTTLPATLGQLTQLRSLNLRNNQLTTLPATLVQLTQLQELYLSNNQLTTLPEALVQLMQLEILDLSNNELTTLPETLDQLMQLQELYLHDNATLGLPPVVLGPTSKKVARGATPANPSEILEYYFRLRGGRKPLNEAKLILVGFGAVGKTSLVNQLVHGKFDKDEEKTEGIQITQWPLRLHNDEDVQLNVWDFGGQEINHSTHQFFLTQRSLYLLVLSGRQGREDAEAEYWLNFIESFGEDSPVIVVLNKIKEHPFDVIHQALEQKFPAICDFIKTDCEDGTGINDLRRAIERETDRLKHLRDAFPASWFTIKDRLAGMEENSISFDRYRDICSELGETDPQAQELLASRLHDLGIALNYKDDHRLRDVHVLNPHWVTNGIYKIINAGHLEQQKGELQLGDLAHILDPAAYPEDRHYFLLELMRKFELCFPFPDEFSRYLIPALLDKQQAEEAGDFNLDECLNFQYHYSVLPEGLLPHFVVRTNVLSTDEPRWRTGVILQFEGNRALVKADVQDKKVFISVDGPVAGRRRLLAIIRSDFERIHLIYKLKLLEMVPVPKHPDVLVPYQELLVMERKRRKRFPKVVGDDVIDLDVQDLLNGVDLEGTRRAARATDAPRAALRLFYSYSHKDEALRNELETHLKLLQRQKLIQPWHDRRIPPGDDWKKEIDDNLERADIILLLVSADFIASDYCYDLEMDRALERHAAGEARLIPIIVRDCKWKKARFAHLQVLPPDGKPVTKWDDRDTAWRIVADGIEEVVEELRAGRASRR